MKSIVLDQAGGCQTPIIPAERTPSFVGGFEVHSVVPILKANGFALLSGLTPWLDLLSPVNCWEAWQALHNKGVADILSSQSGQQPRYFLNDLGHLDEPPQLTIEFKAKTEKSHLTVIEGAESFSNNPLLPMSVRNYFEECCKFMIFVRHYLRDILPRPSLPAILKLRIFHYRTSDPLVELRTHEEKGYAMKPHVDGSICTLIISNSDGLLEIQRGPSWSPAVRPDREPFALLIPGIAAAHDLDVAPTPHVVRPSVKPRVSVTIFFTPELSGNREVAEHRLTQWRLASVESRTVL